MHWRKTIREHSKKVAACKPESESSKENKPCWSLFLNFQVSRTVRKQISVVELSKTFIHTWWAINKHNDFEDWFHEWGRWCLKGFIPSTDHILPLSVANWQWEVFRAKKYGLKGLLDAFYLISTSKTHSSKLNIKRYVLQMQCENSFLVIFKNQASLGWSIPFQ